MFDLTGKVALVTGASAGLGREICEAMAEFGADVACVARTESKIKETAQELCRHGHRAIGISADAFEEPDIKRMVETTIKELGSLDIVFANAAVVWTTPARIHETTPEDWERVASGSIRGVYLLMKYSLPYMMKQQKGCFITTAAGTGIWPLPPVGSLHLATPYITAKAAIIMLTKLAAKQYGEYGIRANVICPGYHRTSYHEADPAGLADMEKFILDVTPLKRVGLQEDIKGMAVYLASDASSFVTGQIIIEDGGFMA